MHTIMCLIEQMESEAHDATEYVECALKYKDTDRSLSDMYAQLARAELEHYGKLEAQVERCISEKIGNDENGYVKELHEWFKKHCIREKDKLRSLIDSYK